MEDLKIYTIGELHELKKGVKSIDSFASNVLGGAGKHGRGPDKKKRKSKGMQTSGGREWQVSGSGVEEEKAPPGYKWPKMPEYKTSWASKSLEESEFEKGRGPDRQPRRRKHSGLRPVEEAEVAGRNKFHSDYQQWELSNKILAQREKEGLPVSKKLRTSVANKPVEKSLGDCYTIDELYELKKGKVYDPGAVAAMIGRKKYGEKKFAEMSAAGRKRKKAPKGKAKMAPGGGGRFAKLEGEIAEKNKGKK
jgi:hypothetical protein